MFAMMLRNIFGAGKKIEVSFLTIRQKRIENGATRKNVGNIILAD
jgi:hypothetical protein